MYSLITCSLILVLMSYWSLIKQCIDNRAQSVELGELTRQLSRNSSVCCGTLNFKIPFNLNNVGILVVDIKAYKSWPEFYLQFILRNILEFQVTSQLTVSLCALNSRPNLG
jgi:hypothetical protein